MNAEKEREDGARPEGLLRIEGEMTIYQAADLKQAFLSCIDHGERLEIDLSSVIEIDTAGVQLLIASRKSAEASGKPWRLAAVSDAVADVFSLLGMADCFGELPISHPHAG